MGRGFTSADVQTHGQMVNRHVDEFVYLDFHDSQPYFAKPGQFPLSQVDGEADDDDLEEEDDLEAEAPDGSNEGIFCQHAVAATAAAEACSKHNPYGSKSSEEDAPSYLRSNISPPPPPPTPPINGASDPARKSSESIPYAFREPSSRDPIGLLEFKSTIFSQFGASFDRKSHGAWNVPTAQGYQMLPMLDNFSPPPPPRTPPTNGVSDPARNSSKPIPYNFREPSTRDPIFPQFGASSGRQNHGPWNVAAGQGHPMMLEGSVYASNVLDPDEFLNASFKKHHGSREDLFDGFYGDPDLGMMNTDTEINFPPMDGDDVRCDASESSRRHCTSPVAGLQEEHPSGDKEMVEHPTAQSNSEDETDEDIKPRHHLRSCYSPPSDATVCEGKSLRDFIKEKLEEALSQYHRCIEWEGLCRDTTRWWEAPESEDKQLELAQRLFACAEAVACRDAQQAGSLLEKVRRMASPYGDSFQRVTACFAEGLAARMEQLGSGPGRAILPPRTMVDEAQKQEGFQLMYNHCPYVQFGYFVANCAILEALEGEKAAHVIDLGMTQWVQWPPLIDALANREGGAPQRLRITGVGCSKERMEEIGKALKQAADKSGMEFEFRAVVASLEGVAAAALGLREGEAVAVNGVLQLHRVVKESRGSLNAVLQAIHALAPKVLTLVEQDASHNGPFFVGRFMEALHYYSAIFDSLQAALPRYCTRRVKIEQFHFAQEIHNIVACEGPARVERHERVEQWRRRMSRAGFQVSPLRLLPDARRWLAGVNATAADAYTLADEKSCLVLGWKGKPIIAASAWRC